MILLRMILVGQTNHNRVLVVSLNSFSHLKLKMKFSLLEPFKNWIFKLLELLA